MRKKYQLRTDRATSVEPFQYCHGLLGLTVNAAKYICVYAQLVRAWMQMLELLIREWYTASICVLLTCVSACLSVEQASCH